MSAVLQEFTAAQYHADCAPEPSLSVSIAKVLLRESPLKAWFSHPRLNPNYEEDEDAKFDLGTAAHAALLENDASKIAVIDPKDYPSKTNTIPDGWTNNAIRAARDAARAAGKTPLLKHHYDDVTAMVSVAQDFIAHSEISALWANAESERTVVWREGVVWMRSRLDRITTDFRVVLDYKSTTDAAPEVFSRQIVRMGYHIQDSFYRRAARSLGATNPRFVFLAQAATPPYECSLHACDPALQEIADAEVERAIGIWTECITKDNWPSHGGRIHWAMPTSWQIAEHEERLLAGADIGWKE